MRILTSGTSSGLGRHIYETLGGMGWTRQLAVGERREMKRMGVDVIIHSAFNSARSISSESIYAYLSDNVLLTVDLAAIPHHKFVFVSSVDVYPKAPVSHLEKELIQMDDVNGVYGVTKLMSEAIVRANCPNFLILRCVSLLGKYSRRNSLIRIMEDDPCKLTLSNDSRFNYILHSDVSDFILFAIERDIQGIYNVASGGNLHLSEISEMFGKNVQFGNYKFDIGNIDNNKISSIFPAFCKTSKEVISQFANERSRTG